MTRKDLSFLWKTFPSEVHSVNKVTDSLKENVKLIHVWPVLEVIKVPVRNDANSTHR